MQHGWVSFLHVRKQAGLPQTAPSITWLGPLFYVGCQFALLLGFWFIGWLRAMWDMAPWRLVTDAQRFLWWLSLPMFMCFLLFGFTTGGGQPNWPVTAYLSGMVLVVGWMRWKWHTAGVLERRAILGGTLLTCLVGLALTLVMHRSEIAYPVLAQLTGPPTETQQVPMRRLDPTCRLRGWRQLAGCVEQHIHKLRQRGIEPVLVTQNWTVPGELSFYLPDHPQVYSVGLALGNRHSQYDFWRPNPIHDPQVFLGRTFIFVGYPNLLTDRGAFSQVETITPVEHVEQGHVVATWHVSVLHGFQGFPDAEPNASY
jgi:hypothetical protein